MTNKTWTMEHQAGPALSGRAIRGLAEFPGRCPGLTNGCAFGETDWSHSMVQPEPTTSSVETHDNGRYM